MALTSAFAQDVSKAAQWRGFLRKVRLKQTPGDLAEVIEVLAAFLGPVAQALAGGYSFEDRWVAPGPWKHREPTEDA